MTRMRIAIIGTGYVGLVSGACLASKGHDVTCVDIDRGVVDRLGAGEPHVFERGLDTVLGDAVRAGRFRATTDLAGALDGADGVVIAVGTPSRDDGEIDLSDVRSAAAGIGRWLASADRFLPIVVKSTVVPGTTDTLVRSTIEQASGKAFGAAFGLGMNPEFLRAGNAVDDFMRPDRIVLGHDDDGTRRFLAALYEPWSCDKLYVGTRAAELIKYASNTLLATQISAINEIANLAAAIGGIDVLDVVRGVHLDRRWNPLVDGRRVEPEVLTYLVPGCGFGGSCFPKDIRALRAQGQALGVPTSLLGAVLEVNDRQPGQVAAILTREVPGLSRRTCLLLGLAFKPDTDDVRETASRRIAADLLDRGCRLIAHDPVATGNFRRALGERAERITFVDDWRGHVAAADVIVVATTWGEYRDLTGAQLGGKVVFDARRMFDPVDLAGARYLTVGRRPAPVDPRGQGAQPAKT